MWITQEENQEIFEVLLWLQVNTTKRDEVVLVIGVKIQKSVCVFMRDSAVVEQIYSAL